MVMEARAVRVGTTRERKNAHQSEEPVVARVVQNVEGLVEKMKKWRLVPDMYINAIRHRTMTWPRGSNRPTKPRCV